MEFKNKIGLPLATYIVIGLMIGGGIFVYPGIVYPYTGGALPLAFLLAVIPVFISMLPLAMLGSAKPQTGANYVYASQMVSPGLAFTGVWVYALASFFGQIPLYLIGCAKYLQGLWPDLPTFPLAFGILTLIYLINMLGIRPAAQFQGLLILMLLAGLLIFITGGADKVEWNALRGMASPGGNGFLLGVALLTFTYFGANGIIEIGSEIKRPGRNIPGAFLIAFPIVLLLYVGMAVVTTATLQAEELAGAEEPLLMAAARNLSGGWFNLFVLGGAVLALLTTLNSLFIIGTRSLLMIVKDRLLPGFMAYRSKRSEVPVVLLTIIYILSVMGLLSGFSLETFASYASLGGLVIFLPILLAAWRFPRLHPDLYENAPFRLPPFWLRFSVGTGILMVLFFGVILLYDLGSVLKTGLFILFILTGIAFYLARRRWLRILIMGIMAAGVPGVYAQENTMDIKVLALGDSYTIGEGVGEAERWPVQWIGRLKARGMEVSELRIIAKTGWRTDQLSSAIDEAALEKNWDWVTILIGVNNQYQGRSSDSYEEELPHLIEKAIELAGGRPDRVIVVSIPDYAFTPFGQGLYPSVISSQLRSYNRINRIVAKRYLVHYVNINTISKQGLKYPDLVAGDGLHPSGKQYAAWVDLLMKEVFKEALPARRP